MAFSTCLYSVGSFFENDGLFYGISYMGRLFQGIADAFVCITIFAIMAIEFPKNTAQYLGYIMMALTFGMSFGPVLSSLVYDPFTSWNGKGYADTFFFFAILILVFGMIPIFFVPNRINYDKHFKKLEQQRKEEEGEDTVENQEEKKEDPPTLDVPFGLFLGNKRVIVMLITAITAALGFTFMVPILAPYLEQHYGMSVANAGLAFALASITAAIGAPIIGKLCKHFDRRYVCLCCIMIETISILLIGPVRLTQLPDKLWITFLGLALAGPGQTGVLVVCMPEIMDAITIQEENKRLLAREQKLSK